MSYRIVLDGRGHHPATLGIMGDREDAHDWAEAVTVGYTVAGLPNGEVVKKSTKQANGDWCLQVYDGNPVYVRVQEVLDAADSD